MPNESKNPSPSPSVYEKLGVFYLGKHETPGGPAKTVEPLLYDSRDLLTHAVCIGMTGSGKTGLGVGLIEEAALDGVPALVIDPKGDMANLLLTFPSLSAEEFLPWVNEEEARRANLETPEYAAQQAALWREGLASWGQTADRIRALREAAEFAIYTPGSEAGLPISVLASFRAPAEEVRSDADLYRDRISTTASSLLGLLGIEADPIQSREHILLSNLLEQRWNQGQDAGLPSLIREIQTPPIDRVGVMDVDTFFPPKDRLDLAMQLNNLLASPSFEAWTTGQPLDIGSLLYTERGRPRVAVLSIAHLSDSERMFFVSLLLNEVVSWMRSRAGTTSLRALVYMDEIFGFVPPVGEPPSKKPMLTLLKQARAFGVGVVLATQNPVDLDYKGLSNAGTWFLGRLQTARDKERVLEGLEGLQDSALTDRATLDRLLSGLGKRVFLMHNVHDREPSLFQTRWVMSYLRGPLTRQQIRRLMDGERSREDMSQTAEIEPQPSPSKSPRKAETPARPSVEPGIEEVFEFVRPDNSGAPIYCPNLLGRARVHVIDRKTRVELAQEDLELFQPVAGVDAGIDWSQAEPLPLDPRDLTDKPAASASWQDLPGEASRTKSYANWSKELADFLYRNYTLELFWSPTFKLRSDPGETEREFRVRLAEAAREQRDEDIDTLRTRYGKEISVLEERLRKARARVDKEKQQASNAKLQTAISIGSTLLSMFAGRKRVSQTSLNKAGSAMRGFGRSSEQSRDVDVAEEAAEVMVEKLEELNSELEQEISEVGARLDAQTEQLEIVAHRPRRSDIDVRKVSLLWMLA
jgi:hypothetical protein